MPERKSCSTTTCDTVLPLIQTKSQTTFLRLTDWGAMAWKVLDANIRGRFQLVLLLILFSPASQGLNTARQPPQNNRTASYANFPHYLPFPIYTSSLPLSPLHLQGEMKRFKFIENSVSQRQICCKCPHSCGVNERWAMTYNLADKRMQRLGPGSE